MKPYVVLISTILVSCAVAKPKPTSGTGQETTQAQPAVRDSVFVSPDSTFRLRLKWPAGRPGNVQFRKGGY